MKVFLKANMASLTSSFCDFASSVILHQFFKVPAITASISGTIVGGVANFFISRFWVYKVSEVSIPSQAKRFLPTWLGNLLLNSAGVYLLIKSGLNYVIAKLVTSVVVAWFYNYPLQKKFVFKNNE